MNLNDDMEYIPEALTFDDSPKQVSLSPPQMDPYSIILTQLSGGTSSSQAFKRKTFMVDAMDTQFDKLTINFDVFVDAIGTINVLSEKLCSIAKRQVMTFE